jgi:transposase-like protein
MKENSDEEFKDRVENDKTIYNHAFQAIEIVPDFDASTSKFIIHKDRFGYKQGRTLHAKFNDGRFEALDLGEV